MHKVGFFTPILCEGKPASSTMEAVEDYFSFGNRAAYVIKGKIDNKDLQLVEIKTRTQSCRRKVLLGALKILSFMTVIIPLLMLCIKAGYRSSHPFYIVDKPTQNQQKVDQTAKLQFQNQQVDQTVKQHLMSPALEPGLNAALPITLKLALFPNADSTAASLMVKFTNAWNKNTKKFDFAPNAFNLDRFTKLLSDHATVFTKKGINLTHHFGYIEKFDLDPSENPHIYMRADLHGDLKSLIENLRTLQEQNHLDANFRCKKGVHLVFLGDYCDRGAYGTQILEMLMRLREENPTQVHLIRGNHEYKAINYQLGFSDLELVEVLQDVAGATALEKFYETMSLTTYFSIETGGPREYVQCTHGLFEPTMDPSPLLDQGKTGYFMPVPRMRKLTARVCKIAQAKNELAKSAQRIQEIFNESYKMEPHLTAYNWADVDDKTILDGLGERWYRLNPRDVKHYLNLCSDEHRVRMIFRGHQHGFQHHMHKGKVIVTTLPVGMDCPAFKDRFNQTDRAYIIQPKNQVSEWRKRAILRQTGNEKTGYITLSNLLTSSAV